jgi:hypothetical protein
MRGETRGKRSGGPRLGSPAPLRISSGCWFFRFVDQKATVPSKTKPLNLPPLKMLAGA